MISSRIRLPASPYPVVPMLIRAGFTRTMNCPFASTWSTKRYKDMRWTRGGSMEAIKEEVVEASGTAAFEDMNAGSLGDKHNGEGRSVVTTVSHGGLKVVYPVLSLLL